MSSADRRRRASRRFIEDILYPGSFAPRLRANRNGRRSVRRGSGMGRAGLFHGRDWEQVAVTPFYANENEIVSYAYFDAYALTPSDVLFKSHGKCKRGFHEAGLAMLPAAASARGAEWNDCVFVVLDFAAALKLQLKWCRGSHGPPPWSFRGTTRNIAPYGPGNNYHSGSGFCSRRVATNEHFARPVWRTPVS